MLQIRAFAHATREPVVEHTSIPLLKHNRVTSLIRLNSASLQPHYFQLGPPQRDTPLNRDRGPDRNPTKISRGPG